MKIFLALSGFSFLSVVLGTFFVSQADFKDKLGGFFGEKGRYNFSWVSNDEKLVQNEEEGKIEVEGLKSLILDVTMGEIKIAPQVEEKDYITYKVQFSGEESPLDFVREGDLFRMSFKKGKNKNSFNHGVEVELLLPKREVPLNFNADIEFGSMELQAGLYFNDFNVDMSAGEMETEALSFVKGSIDLSAGELDMESTDLKEAEVSVSGGSVFLEVVNPAPVVKADVKAGELEFGTADGVEKNFSLQVDVSLGEVDVVDGYTKSGDNYVFGKGEGKVNLEVDLGQVEVF